MASTIESVRCFGQKKMAVVVTHCKQGRRLIKIKGVPIELVQSEILHYKAFETILLLRRHQFFRVDEDPCQGWWWSHLLNIRYRSVDREALVAFYQKYLDEQSKKEMKNILVRYDRTLLVVDPRRYKPKKFGGRGARARFQKSYR